VEALGDHELSLIISRSSRFHNNCLNHLRGGQNQGYFGCGDPDHFVANCPKKNKHPSNKYDVGKRKDKCKYTFGKYKPKGGFNMEALKKKYLKKGQGPAAHLPCFPQRPQQ